MSIRHGIRGNPSRAVISQGDLYSLLLGSELPSAQELKRWVTDDVLPTINKTGSYMKGEENFDLTSDEGLAQASLAVMA